MKQFIKLGFILLFVSCSAFAAPTWIGTYGAFEKHDDTSNPGSFTILMNDYDAWLHAEVGIQVNGESWGTEQMTYVGMVDGNSKWQFTPLNKFTDGDVVNYYFHGYDDNGFDIWDSNNGANYTFTATGNADSTLSFGSAKIFPTDFHGNYQDKDLEVREQYTFLAGSVGNVVFAQRFNKDGLTPSLGWTLYQGEGYLQSAAIDSTAQTIAVAYGVDSGIHYRASTDEGNSPFTTKSSLQMAAKVRAVAISNDGADGFVVAFTVGNVQYPNQLWVAQVTDGKELTNLQMIDSVPAPQGFLGDIELTHNNNGFTLAYGYRQQTYADYLRVAQSVDGSNWETSTIDSSRAISSPSLSSTDDSVAVSYTPFYGPDVHVQRNTGSGWVEIDAYHSNSGGTVKLSYMDNGDLALFKGGNYAISTDNGESWGDLTPIANRPDAASIANIDSNEDGLAILYHKTNSRPLLQTASYSAKPSMVDVNFICHNGNTQWGQNVYVVGNTVELGNWNADNAIQLDASNYPDWASSIEIPAGTSLEWKCIKKDDSSVEWQSGVNNSLQVEANTNPTTIGSF